MSFSTERLAAVLRGLQQLIDLQALDDELSAAEDEQASLPGRRAQLGESRDAAEQRVAAARQALEQAEDEQRSAEVRLQDEEALKRRLEGQQFQVKSNEAYTALLREMEQAAQAISECETRILEAMDAIEAGRAESVAAEEAAAKVLARARSGERALDSRETELAARTAELREARAVLCERVGGELIEQYEKIAARRRPAVVRVEEEICLGCRVNIPPQLYIELLSGQRLVSCSNCHRILIHAGGLEGAGK